MPRVKLPHIEWPERDNYSRFEGEVKLASIAEDLSKIKHIVSDLKLMQVDMTSMLMQEALEQKRFDLFQLNWRRVHGMIQANL